jgi:lysyl-tRNA synthetase class 2
MSSEIFDLKKKQYIDATANTPFADRFEKTHAIGTIGGLADGVTGIKTAGRITSLRLMGKALFANLYDFSGTIQFYIRKSDEPLSPFEVFNRDLAIGDFVGIEGSTFTTRTGEKTIQVERLTVLNKSLRTLPEKFHGIENIETRYRKRYLDVIMNDDTRSVFLRRIEMIKAMRNFLEANGFLEVETPILQTTPSGALAKPFYTHHNALDMPCTLRIAPETWLKRLIGAGFDRVYEFAKCFRNEGISAAHLQEFTMLEFYAAYWNWDDQRDFCTKLTQDVIHKVFGKTNMLVRGHEIDFAGEWPVYTIAELILKDTGIDILTHKETGSLIRQIKAKNLPLDDYENLSWANLVDAVYKTCSRPHLIQPCFVTKYPAEMAPLARRRQGDEAFVDLFQLVVAGIELIKAYSELVDPIEQRLALEDQAKAREQGDVEAMPMDEEFLVAMEHGFPPIAGVGIGIDRLVTVLCEKDNIKESVFFPLMKPELY